MAEDELEVEVVYALPDQQFSETLMLPSGSRLRDAIDRSSLARQFPETDFSTFDCGIWGERKAPDQLLGDGDRVEIYRPLTVDPREARRQRVEKERAGKNKKW